MTYTTTILFGWQRAKFCAAEFSPQGCGEQSEIESGVRRREGERERAREEGKGRRAIKEKTTGLLLCRFRMWQQRQIVVFESYRGLFLLLRSAVINENKGGSGETKGNMQTSSALQRWTL